MDSIFIYSYSGYGNFCFNESGWHTFSQCINNITHCYSNENNKGFKQLIILSVIIGEFSVIMGLVLAFYMNISPGGVIVVLLVLLLGLTMLFQNQL